MSIGIEELLELVCVDQIAVVCEDNTVRRVDVEWLCLGVIR